MSDNKSQKVPNFLTFDIEEWFHANYESVDTSRFKGQSTTLPDLVDILVEDMARHNVVSTCFIVGEVAQKYPGMVKKLHKAGHEIASHSMHHRLVYSLDRKEFFEDTKKSCEILEDIIGAKVCGYRAPSWSVNKKTLPWFYEVLSDCGLSYSSSVFPVQNYLYGIQGAPLYPHAPSGKPEMLEIPCSTTRLYGKRLGFSGGFYMRFFPAWFIISAAQKINRAGEPVVFYLHPREIDNQQEKLTLPLVESMIHYWNIGGTQKKLNAIMKTFQNSYITMRDYAEQAQGNL